MKYFVAILKCIQYKSIKIKKRPRKLFYRQGMPFQGVHGRIFPGFVALLGSGLLWAAPPSISKEATTAAVKLPPVSTEFRDVLEDGGIAPVLTSLPGGTFAMGSPNSEEGRFNNEGPVHDVTLDAFMIGRYEVTNAEYVAFLNAVKKRGTWQEPWFRAKEEDPASPISGKVGAFVVDAGFENHPVVNVSWYGAQAYVEWLSKETGAKYRLPTEAEWEYAARAETVTPFYTGRCIDTDQANYNGNDTAGDCPGAGVYRQKTVEAGAFPANPFGLHDMAGNVLEWVNDWYGAYSAVAQTNPAGPETGSLRVYRGGAWVSARRHVRTAFRGGTEPRARLNFLGFRLARTLSSASFTPTNPIMPQMQSLPGGTFKMGDAQGDGESDEKPVHEVTLSPFEIGKYEVTVGEFKRFAEAENYRGRKPDFEGDCKGFMQPGFEQEDNHPVVCITWDDTQAYIAWLNRKTGKDYRLPSEAEWEFSARGGMQTAYWWGDDIGYNNANCNGCGDSFGKTAPVGSFQPNPFGLYDTAGNVWEWVADLYEDYSEEAQKDPTGPKEGFARLGRGGAWASSPRLVRSASRVGWFPGNRYIYFGFRLARTIP